MTSQQDISFLLVLVFTADMNNWSKTGKKMFRHLCREIESLRNQPQSGKVLEESLRKRFLQEDGVIDVNSYDGKNGEEESDDDDECYIDPLIRDQWKNNHGELECTQVEGV